MNESKILSGVIAGICGIVLPPGEFLLFVYACIFCDSFFGVISLAYKDEKFDWRKLIFKGIIIKTIIYTALVLLAYWGDELLLNDTLIFRHHIVSKIVIFYILIGELGSIWGHAKVILGLDSDKNTNLMEKFLNFIRRTLDKLQGK